jgi:hypothetical protein
MGLIAGLRVSYCWLLQLSFNPQPPQKEAETHYDIAISGIGLVSIHSPLKRRLKPETQSLIF